MTNQAMRRLKALIATLLGAVTMTACSATAEDLIGEAKGYGGTLRVAVTMDGDRITAVRVTEHHETDGIGTRAIDSMPDAMVAANSADVDTVSGATVTSKALQAAVRNALGQDSTASPSSTSGPDGMTATSWSMPDGARQGIGICATGRIGPGSDDQGIPVYSFNVVMASAVFDAEGRILNVLVDQLEVATPNYDGASMPQFSGWPGQGGYALWDDAAGKTSGLSGDTEEDFLTEVSGWTTKRARGESYMLTSGSWQKQMDAYQQAFTGKTVDEIEDWFERSFSDETGRPLKDGAGTEADQIKYGALSEDEQLALADVVSGATMSLRDSHGDIITALRRAWENASGEKTQLTN